MPDKDILILNFDDSVVKQKNLLARYRPEVIDLRDLGPAARFWTNPRDRREIERRIRGLLSKNSIVFLGSGDFHQITNILVSRFKEPISLIDFDLHPDWSILPPRLSCGAWLTETLRSKNILKCVLTGIASNDISSFSIETGNFAALKDDRLEIYPYSHYPSIVFGRVVPENISMRTKKHLGLTKIYWNELNSVNIMEFFLHVLKRLPTKDVYITIDKDCLNNEHALTNWEEGRMSLDELLMMLKLIKEKANIVGVDITGDYSKISVKGTVKNLISRINHPRRIKALDLSESVITSVNEETNLRILDILKA